MASRTDGGTSETKAIEVIAAMGGNARNKALSKAERSEIARRGGLAKAAKAAGLPKETHYGVLKLGPGIPCSVLDNGHRVFSVNGLLRAFGSGAKSRATLDGGTPVPEFLSAANLQSFISPALREKLENTEQFRPLRAGSLALGYEADILNLICDALLDARTAGVLRANQLRIARAAEVLMRAFSKVGLIALIDEATGYQYDRAHDELQRLVALFVVEDMRPWVRMFPDAFFRRVYKLYGWPYKPGVTQGPRYVGKFIDNYIYKGLPDAVLARLRERNPVINSKSQRRHKHFQFLTEDVGEPALDRRLASVMTLMDVSQDKNHFKQMYRVAFPKLGEQLVIGATVRPALSAGSNEDEDVAEEDLTEIMLDDSALTAPGAAVGGVQVVTVVTRTSEKVLAVLRQNKFASLTELGVAAYGCDPTLQTREGRNTRNKLTRLLDRMRGEGLVESPAPRMWGLAPG